MNDKMTFIEPLLERAEAYGKTSYELIKLKAVDKTADVASTMVSRGAVILVLSMFVVIITFSARFLVILATLSAKRTRLISALTPRSSMRTRKKLAAISCSCLTLFQVR